MRVRPGPLLTNEATQAAADASANVESVAAASGTDQAPPSPSNVEEAEAHFHAVTVSERELTEFRMIFDKKKGADGLIALATVRMVLQSYWRFIHREGFEANVRPFPEERLEQLRRKVDASNGLTLEQFLTGDQKKKKKKKSKNISFRSCFSSFSVWHSVLFVRQCGF